MASYLDEDEELQPLDAPDEVIPKRPVGRWWEAPGVAVRPDVTGDSPVLGGMPSPDIPNGLLPGEPSIVPGPIPVAEKARTANQRVADITGEKPNEPKPKWWQRLAAAGVGAAAGYVNAEGKLRHPIDASGAGDAIMGGGGYQRKLSDWRNKVAGAQAQADAANSDQQNWWKNRQLQTDEDYKAAQEKRLEAQAGREAGRNDADATKAKQADAEKQDTLALKGREDAYLLKQGEQPPAGWDMIQSAANPGRAYAAPPRFAKLPPELVGYAPGRKAGDVVPASELKAARAAAQKDVLAQNKPPVRPELEQQIADRTKAADQLGLSGRDRMTYIATGQIHPPPAAAPGSSADDPKIIAQGIMNGHQPPDTKGLYRNGSSVRAELERNGYDLMTAQRDWTAVQKHLATMNGQQQERLRQAVSFTYDSLDQIEQLYDEWKTAAGVAGMKIFNRANLAASKHLPGKAGEAAQLLEAQINDLTSELGTVYKGGNGSTDESLRLAGENLKAEWNENTFKRGVQQIRKNLQIRRNSINNSQAAGVSADSPYMPQQQPNAGGGRGNAGGNGPQANPNPKGYVVGHVYGGLTYLGGDPNNKASWK